MALPQSITDEIRLLEEMRTMKPFLHDFILDALQAYGPEAKPTSTQYCGICLSGALDNIETTYINYAIDRSGSKPVLRKSLTFPKKPCPMPGKTPAQTDEADGRLWTALLRVFVQPRTESEFLEFLECLNDTSSCPCSTKMAERMATPPLQGDISLRDLHLSGRALVKRYLTEGYLLPSTEDRLGREPSVQYCPQTPCLRGKAQTSMIYMHRFTSEYLPPIQKKELGESIEPSRVFVICLIRMLGSTITARSNSSSFIKGRSHSWPYSPNAFLALVANQQVPNSSPHFPAYLQACAVILVQTFEQWTAELVEISHCLTMLLVTIINMCGTLVLHPIIERSYSTRVVPPTTLYVIEVGAELLRLINDHEPALSHLRVRRGVGWWVIQHFEAIVAYFGTVSSRDDMPPEWFRRLIQSCDLGLAQLLTLMLYLLEDSRIPQSIKRSQRWTQIRSLAGDLWSMYYINAREWFTSRGFSRDASSCLLCHPHFLDRFAELLRCDIQARQATTKSGTSVFRDGIEGSRNFFLGALKEMRERTYCFTAGCYNSIYVVGVDFKTCSGCGIVRYCGRDCQKLDWKGLNCEGHSVGKRRMEHSKVCGLLSKFRGLSPDEVLESAKEVVLEDEHWLLLRDWSEGIDLYFHQTGTRYGFGATGTIAALTQGQEEHSTAVSAQGGLECFEDKVIQFMVQANAAHPVIAL